MIAVVDYGRGNLRSVLNALELLGADARLVASGDELGEAEKVVLPGVGAFGEGMAELDRRGFTEAIPRLVEDGRPLLGICLGMQLLADRGTEHGEHAGLGLIPGSVERIETDPALRIPHVGWNVVQRRAASPLLSGLDEDPTFYFVHSFHFLPADEHALTATAPYGVPVTAAVEGDGVHGVQFHPEKSQDDGLRLLENFIAL